MVQRRWCRSGFSKKEGQKGRRDGKSLCPQSGPLGVGMVSESLARGRHPRRLRPAGLAGRKPPGIVSPARRGVHPVWPERRDQGGAFRGWNTLTNTILAPFSLAEARRCTGTPAAGEAQASCVCVCVGGGGGEGGLHGLVHGLNDLWRRAARKKPGGEAERGTKVRGGFLSSLSHPRQRGGQTHFA